MRTLVCGALAALVLALPITSACAARSESLGLTAPDGTYAVAASGLTADNQKAVQEAIQKIADVKDVAVDAAKGSISVTMKGDAVLKEAAVAEAMKASGGAVTSFTAPADQEVVWMMTYSGGGGWGAPEVAKEVRATLQKMSQIAEVYVDNTSRAVIRAKDGVALDKDAVNGAIKPRKVKVLKEVRRPMVGTVYTLKADGYAWADSSAGIREILEKLDGVIAAMPFADSVLRLEVKKGVEIKEEMITKAFAGTEFKLQKFEAKK